MPPIRKTRRHVEPPTIYSIKQLLDKSISGNNAEKLLGFFTLLTAYVPGCEQFLLIRGSTSVGKTYLLSTVMRLMPQEDIYNLSFSSDQAAWYDEDLSKCRIINAAEMQKHNDTVKEIIKSMHSRDEGAERKVAAKWGQEVHTQYIEPKVVAITFADEWFDEQLSTRCVTIDLPEDWDTNEEVVEFLMEQVETPFKCEVKRGEIEDVREHIRAMPQESKVIIPFMRSFLSCIDRRYVRIRSDISKHFSLIASSAVFHHNNRLRTKIEGEDVIFATPEDAYLVYAASGQILSKTTSQLDDIQAMLMDIIDDKDVVTITEAQVALRGDNINMNRKRVEWKLEKLVDQGAINVEKDKGIKNYSYAKSLAENIERVDWTCVFDYCEKRMAQEYPDQYEKYMDTVKTKTIDPITGETVDILKQTTYLVPPKILQEQKETKKEKAKGTIDGYTNPEEGFDYSQKDTNRGMDDY